MDRGQPERREQRARDHGRRRQPRERELGQPEHEGENDEDEDAGADARSRADGVGHRGVEDDGCQRACEPTVADVAWAPPSPQAQQGRADEGEHGDHTEDLLDPPVARQRGPQRDQPLDQLCGRQPHGRAPGLIVGDAAEEVVIAEAAVTLPLARIPRSSSCAICAV